MGENDKQTIKAVCDYLRQESEKRQLKSTKLRGKKLVRHQRVFDVGDIVKFNLENNVGFGKVRHKDGKFYKIDRIDKSGQHEIHASQLQKVLIPENYLKSLLCF